MNFSLEVDLVVGRRFCSLLMNTDARKNR